MTPLLRPIWRGFAIGEDEETLPREIRVRLDLVHLRKIGIAEYQGLPMQLAADVPGVAKVGQTVVYAPSRTPFAYVRDFFSALIEHYGSSANLPPVIEGVVRHEPREWRRGKVVNKWGVLIFDKPTNWVAVQ